MSGVLGALMSYYQQQREAEERRKLEVRRGVYRMLNHWLGRDCSVYGLRQFRADISKQDQWPFP